MQTNSYGNNLRILRGVKFKKVLDHDFAAAQPLSKSGGDQVNCTIGGIDLRRAHEIRSAKIGIEFGTLPTATERSYKLVYKFFITGGFCGMFLLPPLKPPP
jgi:hypothetical protein